MRNGSLQQSQQLPLISGERARNKRGAQLNSQGAGIDGGRSLITPVFSLDPRSAVAETALWSGHRHRIFNQVDDGQIAPHQVHELADSDG